MVNSFGGSICPGTPDGMFEEWDGALTCVQVVRVPFTPDMTPKDQEDVIYNTVLDKIVKSQQWMKFTHVVPHEFMIFCWCQGWPETAGDRTQELIDRVRNEGWPFMLKLMVPTEPGALFPAKFAYQRAGREGGEHSKRKPRHGKYSELDLSTYDPEDFISDDEPLEWYIFDDEEEDTSLESQLDSISQEPVGEPGGCQSLKPPEWYLFDDEEEDTSPESQLDSISDPMEDADKVEDPCLESQSDSNSYPTEGEDKVECECANAVAPVTPSRMCNSVT